MNTLKLNFTAYTFIATLMMTIFITSCQQEDLSTLPTDNLSETELRNCTPQAPNKNVAISYINDLALEIQERNANRPSNISGFYDSYANYLEDVLCLEQSGIDINWINTECSYNGPNSGSCPVYTVGALQRLKCDIKAFDSNSSCANARSLQIRFVDYIKTLNICFDIGLKEEDYANSLRLPPCENYNY